MAANQAVSPSSAEISSASDRTMSSVCEFLSSRMCPSLFMARQLRAKHAFLLVPASLHDNIRPMDEICKQEVYVVQWLDIPPNWWLVS